MLIKRTDHYKVTNNFNIHEFYSKSLDAPFEHEFNGNLIDVCQYIREQLSMPIVVTSTFRTVKGNALVGGSKSSYHLKGLAVDITAKDINKLINFVYENMSLLNERFSICGFGFYRWGVHLDVGCDSVYIGPSDKFHFWIKNSQINIDEQDGVSSSRSFKFGFVFFLFFLFLYILRKFRYGKV